MKKSCVILGGGGHAKAVIEALRAEGRIDVVAIVDANESRKGEQVLGVPIVGDDAALPSVLASGVALVVSGIGGVKNNGPRRRAMEAAVAAGFTPAGVVHPAAIISPSARISPSAQVLAGAIIGPDAIVGDGVIINTRAVVEHDCHIEEFAHVATGAVLAGTVTIEALAHVGAGATVRQDVRIGRGAVVGAGAVVIQDVEPGQVVVGVPARPL